MQCPQALLHPCPANPGQARSSRPGNPTIYPSSRFTVLLSADAPVESTFGTTAGRSPSEAGCEQEGARPHPAASSQPRLPPGCFSGLVRSSQPDHGSTETFPEPSSPSPAVPLSSFTVRLLWVWPAQADLITYATVTWAVGRNVLSSEPVGHQADYWSFRVASPGEREEGIEGEEALPSAGLHLRLK